MPYSPNRATATIAAMLVAMNAFTQLMAYWSRVLGSALTFWDQMSAWYEDSFKIRIQLVPLRQAASHGDINWCWCGNADLHLLYWCSYVWHRYWTHSRKRSNILRRIWCFERPCGVIELGLIAINSCVNARSKKWHIPHRGRLGSCFWVCCR